MKHGRYSIGDLVWFDGWIRCKVIQVVNNGYYVSNYLIQTGWTRNFETLLWSNSNHKEQTLQDAFAFQSEEDLGE